MSVTKFIAKTFLKTGASMGADVQSDSFNIQRMADYALQFVWSAGSTPVGTVTLQYSNDGSQWDSASSSLNVSGNSGSNSIKGVTGPAFVRGIYTYTSGSGTLDITIVAKGHN